MKQDVLVLGGGVIGVCSAYYLNKQGYRVTVIDKNEIGKGCSFGNAGYITPSHFIPLSAPGMISKGLKWMFNPESPFYMKPRFDASFIKWLFQFSNACTNKHVHHVKKILLELNLQSMSLYKELRSEINFLLEQNGLLMLYNSEKGLEGEAKTVQMANELGLNATLVSKKDVLEKEPELDLDILGGAFYPEDGHTNPYQFVSALRSYLESRGVNFIEHSEITDISVQNKQITSVRCSEHEFTATQYVLAMGSWSPSLAKKLALNLPVQAGKGYSTTFKNTLFNFKTPFILTEAKVAVTPLQDEIRFGGTMELSGNDLTINQRRVNGILKSIKSYYPKFNPDLVSRQTIWSGLRPCSPDGVPIIGRYKSCNNLVIATGHAMMGLSLGPITGKLVEEIISESPSSLPLHQLTPERF